MRATIATNREALDPLGLQQPFTNFPGSFWADNFLSMPDDTGRLPREQVTDLRLIFNALGALSAPVYIVFSYQTPIGYIDLDGSPVIFDGDYSQTTRTHIEILRQAWPNDMEVMPLD